MPPTQRPSRRAVLATGAALASASGAGCLFSPGPSKGATDVVVHNETTEPITAALTIADAGADEPRIDRTLQLAPASQTTPTDDDKLLVGADYVVEVAVEDGPTETYRWEDVSLDLAPLHVLLDGSSNVVFALQAG